MRNKIWISYCGSPKQFSNNNGDKLSKEVSESTLVISNESVMVLQRDTLMFCLRLLVKH